MLALVESRCGNICKNLGAGTSARFSVGTSRARMASVPSSTACACVPVMHEDLLSSVIFIQICQNVLLQDVGRATILKAVGYNRLQVHIPKYVRQHSYLLIMINQPVYRTTSTQECLSITSDLHIQLMIRSPPRIQANQKNAPQHIIITPQIHASSSSSFSFSRHPHLPPPLHQYPPPAPSASYAAFFLPP